MEIITLPATTKGPAAMFAGDVWFDVVAPPQAEPSRMKVNIVHFSPGAHTAWHSHVLGQTLHVTEGVGPETTWGQHLTDDEYPSA